MGSLRTSLLLVGILLTTKALGNPVVDINGTEVEGEYIEDALSKWLANFDSYTFMVAQDVDESDGDGGEGEGLVPDLEIKENELEGEEGEEEEEESEEGSSAPISLDVTHGEGLLNPDVDYKVRLESLVAEEGSLMVTLGTFGNKTTCGVGGFSLPPEATGRGVPEGRLNISHQQEGNRGTTFVPFAVGMEMETEDNTTNTTTWGDEGSDWEGHSQNLWWAMGRLTGGGLLTLFYTPPECGCLMIKAYYALPIGENLTLVVGPEAYPSDLQKLLCIDPSSHRIQDNLIEDEINDEMEAKDALEESNPLQEEEEGDLDPANGPGEVRRGRGRWAAGKHAKLEKKKLRQQARQAIRRAGSRVTRQKVQQHMRHRRRDDSVEETTSQSPAQRGGEGGKRERKQARKARKQAKKNKRVYKGKRPWKKHRKHGRKHGNRNKHNRRNRHHRNHNMTDTTPSPEDEFDDHHNVTEAENDEDELADLLLSDDDEEGQDENSETAEDDDITGSVTRRGRKHRRQRMRAQKWKNKGKKKGARFCCKQGIKYKKSHLVLHTDDEIDQPPVLCNSTNDVISTFAAHQFSIESDHCSFRYETCCTKFTQQLWETVQAKKVARKAKRKQQRKAARQQKRQQKRRQRGDSTTPATPSS